MYVDPNAGRMLVSLLMLNFSSQWRFRSPGPLNDPAVRDFFEVILRITTSGNGWNVLEAFKARFAASTGESSSRSSSRSWAESDLADLMNRAAVNAPLFIEAFYDTCEALSASGTPVPDISVINEVLAQSATGYEIQPPDLVRVSSDRGVIAPPQPAVSLDEQAQIALRQSLGTAEQFLQQGQNRPAVQELLWLLETIATAFEGVETDTGTVQGNYFNKIIADLRAHHVNAPTSMVLAWCNSLHGYLSSPTGGGIRHGTHVLKADLTLSAHEARLYCNLIRSYIFFLIEEHARLTGVRQVLS